MPGLSGLSGISGDSGVFGAPGLTAYARKVIGYSPIAYWIQGETAGLTAVDQINSPAQDGVYVGVTLGQEGIGDGNVCPDFDGAADYNDIYTATFAAAFSGAAGTVSIWPRVSGVGVWTDGVERRVLSIRVDGQNRIVVAKAGVNNTLRWAYEANNVIELIDQAGYTTTDFFLMSMTWDINAGATGEMRAYFNGAQVGATQDNLGVWVGALDITRTVIGASNTAPATNVWDGYLAHCAVWDRALTPAEILSLATV